MCTITETDARSYLDSLHAISAADMPELQAAKAKLRELRANGATIAEIDAAQVQVLKAKVEALASRASCYDTLLKLSLDDLRDCRQQLAVLMCNRRPRTAGRPTCV